jgi:hypothetical protein
LAEDAENHTNSAWEEKGRGGGGTDVAGLSYLACSGFTWSVGGGGGGVVKGRPALVLDAACLHLALHYVSLSHLSILLWGSLSI